MYLLAAAFFVTSFYHYYVGDIQNAAALLGVSLVLIGARYVLGPLEEASLIRKAGYAISIIFLIVAVVYTVLAVLE